MNKAVLLQIQQAKAKELEMKNYLKHIYENVGYEGDDVKQDADSNSMKDPTDASRPSQVIENQQEKEERIDRF